MVTLNAVATDQNLARHLFRDEEWAWMQGFYTELMNDPSRWVVAGIDLINDHSASQKAYGVNYTYAAEFLAHYQVCYWVFRRCLEPDIRSRFAKELHPKPYELELLKLNPYTSTVIAAVLAETPGPAGSPSGREATSAVVLVQCRHCRGTYEYTAVSCSWCGSPR
jgi:hypothetical protein